MRLFACSMLLLALMSGVASAAQAKPSAGASTQETPAARAKGRITEDERSALTYTSYDLEVHLTPEEHSIAVRARMAARNDSGKPLIRMALQVSSSLHWESIRADGAAASFVTELLDSDIDHTGKLVEAVVTLSRPIPPGATVQLDALYSGPIRQSAERLLRIGAPAAIAESSEWDEIRPGFTALRGFGNVIWFPVSTEPVLLGQGARMFDSVGKWKLRESGATLSIRLTVEYLRRGPSAAFLDGYVVAGSEPRSADASGSDTEPLVPRVQKFTLSPTRLGFDPLSLFVTYGAAQQFPGLEIYARRGNESAAASYAKIAGEDRPSVQQYLGAKQKRPVVLVDLPEPADLPFEDRNILLLPLESNPAADSIGPVLGHMLSHAYFISPRPWLDEGVAQWTTLFWIEQRAGRAAAIAQMESRRAALSLAETSDPGVNPGQSLIGAWSDIYYRDKAADVLWMLRDLVGDRAFARSLEAYDAREDREPSYLQQILQKVSGKDFEWFFDDWVYRDRGLPDLHIASAYRRPIMTKNSTARNFLVSAEVENSSFCAADVPVTVESDVSSQTKRLLVPAHGSAAVRFLVAGMPSRVLVNDGSVPEVRTSHHEMAITTAQ